MEGKKLDKKAHENREDLTGEHPLGDMGQIILFVVFLAIWISDSFIFHYSDFLRQYIPLLVRIVIGVIFLVISVYFFRASHKAVFATKREKPTILREGVFRRMRHPMYLSAILLYLGLLSFTLSISAAIVWLITFGFYHFIASYEEKLLVEKFSDDYRQYQSEIPMWIPWIK
jgi:protein-S-isoprenylcysteine O-methyltransferase Ste14